MIGRRTLSKGENMMTLQEFEAEMVKAKKMENSDLDHETFWMGYTWGLRKGFYEEEFVPDEEHGLWWALAEENDGSRKERGMGYRAGFRCGVFGPEYCSKESFCCESCSLIKKGLDCHNNLL